MKYDSAQDEIDRLVAVFERMIKEENDKGDRLWDITLTFDEPTEQVILKF